LTPLHNLERMAVVWSTPNQGRRNKEFEKVEKNDQLFCNNDVKRYSMYGVPPK